MKKLQTLWVKIVEHSSLVSVLWVQPMMLESHGWKCPIGQHSQPTVEYIFERLQVPSVVKL